MCDNSLPSCAILLCTYNTINGDGDAAYFDLRWFVELMEPLFPKRAARTFVFVVVVAVCTHSHLKVLLVCAPRGIMGSHIVSSSCKFLLCKYTIDISS